MVKSMELSKRLQTIADMVSEGNRLVDIGTDHGYIPIYLIQKNRIPSALAMDVGEGPLERAKAHIQAYCLEEKVVCRLSDGFENYQDGEADTAVIAGMGGDLMEKILSGGRGKLPKELILQPQSEWFKVRRFLKENGYTIVREEMLIEDGKYYVAMKAKKGEGPSFGAVEEAYGPYLLKEKNLVLKEYLNGTIASYEKIMEQLEKVETPSAKKRKLEIQAQFVQLKGALAYYER